MNLFLCGDHTLTDVPEFGACIIGNCIGINDASAYFAGDTTVRFQAGKTISQGISLSLAVFAAFFAVGLYACGSLQERSDVHEFTGAEDTPGGCCVKLHIYIVYT